MQAPPKSRVDLGRGSFFASGAGTDGDGWGRRGRMVLAKLASVRALRWLDNWVAVHAVAARGRAMRVRVEGSSGSVIRVVGVGSSHGDDRVGWLVVEQLAASWSDRAGETGPTIDLAVLADPLGLIDQIDDGDALIVVDACRSGRPAGTVIDATWNELRGGGDGGEAGDSSEASSHGLGVVSALRLAEALGRIQDGRAVVLVGVEVGDAADAMEPGAPVSAAVIAAIEPACRTIAGWIERLEGEGG